MTKAKAAFFAITMFLVSCSRLSSSTILPVERSRTPVSSRTATPVTEISSTLSPTGTFTPMLASHTPTATLSSTTPPDLWLKARCLEIFPNLPPYADAKGIVVLEGGNYLDSYLLDLKTGNQVRLPRKEKEDLGSFSVSPNRQLLAYFQDAYQSSADKMIIMTANGQQRRTIPKEENWFMVADWLDNERLLISPRNVETDPVPLIVLNPFSSQSQKIQPDYPKILSLTPPYLFWEGFTLSETVYDRSLDRVVYPQNVEGIEAIVLWDVQNGKEVVQLPGMTYYSRTPKWSPDGSSFIINSTLSINDPRHKNPHPEMIGADQELFRINWDGKVEKLTDYTSLFKKVNFGYFSWSPDGRYVAFWVQVEPDQYQDLYPDFPLSSAERLAIMNMETKEVTDYCIPGNAFHTWSSAPVWSPDSSQILIESYSKNDTNRVILIDIQKSFAALLVENLTPVGWMVNMP